MATMPQKNKKKRDQSGAATSLPQIRRPPPKYLTKNDDNEEFHKQYGKRLSDLTQKQQRLTEALEELKLSLKRLSEEEETAAMAPAGRKKLKRLIPIYQEQRETKDHIRDMTDELKKLNLHIERVQKMEQNLHLRERIFEEVSLDVNKVKRRDLGPEARDFYLDKKIDIEKLKKVKRGMYLDILETSVSNGKLSFAKNEKKYDLDKIVEYQKQYAIDNQLRLEQAAFKHKLKMQRQEQRVLQMKMLRNSGQYNPNRDSLYPDDDDEFGDVDFRGMSARSSAERNVSGSHSINVASKRAGSALPREDSYDKKLEDLLKKRGKLDELSSKTGGGGVGTLAKMDNTVSRNESAGALKPVSKKQDLDLDFMDGGSQQTSGQGKTQNPNQKSTMEPQGGSKPKLFGNPAPTQQGVSGNKDQLAAPVQPPMKKFTTSDEAKIGDMSFKPITDGKYPDSPPNNPATKPKPAVVPKPSALPKMDAKPATQQPAKEKDLQDDWSQEFNDKGLNGGKSPAGGTQKAGGTTAPKTPPVGPVATNPQPTVINKPPAQAPAPKQQAPADEAFDFDNF